MGLYPKKLRNIDALEQERKLLLRKLAKLDKEDIISTDGILNNLKNLGGLMNGGLLSTIVGFLPGMAPVAEVLIKLVTDRFSKADEEVPPQSSGTKSGGKSKKNILTRAAIEFIGGYLKWKALELSVKGIRHLIKKRKATKS